MRRLLPWVILLAGCRHQVVEDPEPENNSVAVTVVSNGVELFAERSESGAGEWTLYLTRLADSKPVNPETCEVAGVRGGMSEPGIVKLIAPADATEVTCTIAGKTIRFEIAGMRDVKSPGAIRFSKEQQWILDFATGLPEKRILRESLRVAAEIRARPGAIADVSAPLAGRVTMSPSITLGANVERGSVVASVLPPTTVAGDLVSIQLTRDDAQVALDSAKRELDRAERLVAAGAAPQRRLDEAQAAARAAEARMNAARLRLEQYDSSRESDDREVGARRFSVRASLTGAITEIFSQTGAYVETGAPLARIVDTAILYVVGFVPESDLPRLPSVGKAEIELNGGTVMSAKRFVSRGPVLDPETRTLPVTYEIENPSGRLAVNQAAHLLLWLPDSRTSLAVPDAAVVNEGPQQVVFVQIGGESFARRVVQPGMRTGGWVEIRSGLSEGERIVTKGAYLLRLASLAGQLPTEGHVH